MIVRICIQSEATPILRQMAKEAGVQVHDLCEIAVYNLIGLWGKDHEAQLAVLVPDGVDTGRK